MHNGEDRLRIAVKDLGISEEWLWEKPPPGTFRPWQRTGQPATRQEGGGRA